MKIYELIESANKRNLFLRSFLKLRLVCEAVHLEFRALAHLQDENYGALQVVKYRDVKTFVMQKIIIIKKERSERKKNHR